jgi:carbon-monoxide dehydrogenase small subunit
MHDKHDDPQPGLRPALFHEISFRLNGVRRCARVTPGMSALQMLRDVLGMTGTKYGCGEGECGACTILSDDVSVNACLMFALDCDGRRLTTIEGLAEDGRGAALRESFAEHGAVQCGFCTPGMVVQASHLLAQTPQPDATTAKRAIEGNLCRCTGYQKIVDAIVDAGEKLAQGATR